MLFVPTAAAGTLATLTLAFSTGIMALATLTATLALLLPLLTAFFFFAFPHVNFSIIHLVLLLIAFLNRCFGFFKRH